MYESELKIKMKSIEPNYDYSVYNMATEAQVKTVEKYFGGEKACFFECLDPEEYTDKNGETKIRYSSPTPVSIEMQRHHFNTPNLPAIFGLGALAGNPKGLNAVVWEPVNTELSQHDFGHNIVDISDMTIIFGTALQKNTNVQYFGISNVFSAIGGFLVSLKGVALIAYAFFFGKMIKKQFARLLYNKNQKAIDDEKKVDGEMEEAKEMKGNDWEDNEIDRMRKAKMKILNKIKNLDDGASKMDEKDEDKMVDYFFTKLDYFGSNEHTFETETKLDLF